MALRVSKANSAGAILAVPHFERSVAFYRDAIGFEVEALYEDPPYATLTLETPRDHNRQNVVLVVEVDDARAEHERLGGLGVEFLADPYEPPRFSGRAAPALPASLPAVRGCRFFCVDTDRSIPTLI